jgi:hypothetical protein
VSRSSDYQGVKAAVEVDIKAVGVEALSIDHNYADLLLLLVVV